MVVVISRGVSAMAWMDAGRTERNLVTVEGGLDGRIVAMSPAW